MTVTSIAKDPAALTMTMFGRRTYEIFAGSWEQPRALADDHREDEQVEHDD
jgi:hypothetical protein